MFRVSPRPPLLPGLLLASVAAAVLATSTPTDAPLSRAPGSASVEAMAAVPAAPAAAPTVTAEVARVAAARNTARSTAVRRALTKVGAPYRWGAAGPNAFDCSGLVSWAYSGSGVALPRSSRAMAGVGKRVSRSELRPGDLVFFYRPISHVGIYVGNGRIVHASTKKSPVKVSDMSRMRFTTARRI